MKSEIWTTAIPSKPWDHMKLSLAWARYWVNSWHTMQRNMDSWKLNSYKEEHLERQDLGKILTQLNPPILCHPFFLPIKLSPAPAPFFSMVWIWGWSTKMIEIDRKLTQPNVCDLQIMWLVEVRCAHGWIVQ